MPDFDGLDYRYSDGPNKAKRSPMPGPPMGTVRLTRPVTDHTRAKALEVLRSYDAMDVAAMLGLTEVDDDGQQPVGGAGRRARTARR